MAGNFVAGLMWGGLVAGLGLAVISPMAPLLGPKMGKSIEVGAPAAENAPVAEPTTEAAKSDAAEPAEVAAATPDPAKADPAKTETTPEAVTAPEVQAEPAPDATKDAILMPAKPAAPAEPKAGGETATATPEAEPPQTAPPQTAPAEPAPAEPAPAEMAAAEPAPAEPAPAEPAGAGPAPAEPAPAATTAEPATSAVTPSAEPAPAAPVPDEPAAAPADPAGGVTTNRLPSIGKSTEEPADAPATAVADAVIDATPLVRFARPFENITGNPPMAVLLIDDGSETLDREALAALPFPVTFVIDPLAFNAPDAAAIYRAAGQEVAMLASGIPEGAKASDLEQTFQTHDAVLPEAVAYVDLAKGGFQGNGPLATEVVTTLAPRGRGLVTYDQGLNAADKVAQRAGMAHAVIFRVLDAEDESTPLVRRYLGRAAFKAAQEGGAIVIGRARPETVAALVEWSVEDRTSAVSIAPLSVLLQAGR